MTIGGATRVACVIGDPVEHSRSPLMHTAAAEALGLNRVYVALRVAPTELGRRFLNDVLQIFLPPTTGGQ